MLGLPGFSPAKGGFSVPSPYWFTIAHTRCVGLEGGSPLFLRGCMPRSTHTTPPATSYGAFTLCGTGGPVSGATWRHGSTRIGCWPLPAFARHD